MKKAMRERPCIALKRKLKGISFVHIISHKAEICKHEKRIYFSEKGF